MRKDQNVDIPRSSGILLHPTSLPSGKLYRDAYRFVDWLAAAGQSLWQVLPLGPPDEHGSPYRSPSAFAASPLLLARPDGLEIPTWASNNFVFADGTRPTLRTLTPVGTDPDSGVLSVDVVRHGAGSWLPAPSRS